MVRNRGNKASLVGGIFSVFNSSANIFTVVSFSKIRASLVVGLFLVLHFASANIFGAATQGLTQLQTQLLVFAVVAATFVFTVGAVGKSMGAEWGQRAMVSSIVGIILAGAAVTVIGLFAPGAGG